MTENYVLTPRIIWWKACLTSHAGVHRLDLGRGSIWPSWLSSRDPGLAVLKVFVRFLDELYLRSDLYLAPAVSPFGRIEQTSTAQEATWATTKPASGTFRMDLGMRQPARTSRGQLR